MNSVFSTISSGEELIEVAVAGGASDRIASKLRVYRLVDLENDKPVRLTRFTLMDVWGLTREDNYGEFASLFKGTLPSRYCIHQSVLQEKIDEKEAHKTTAHCVILFVPIGEFQTDVETMFIKKMKDFIRKISLNSGSKWKKLFKNLFLYIFISILSFVLSDSYFFLMKFFHLLTLLFSQKSVLLLQSHMLIRFTQISRMMVHSLRQKSSGLLIFFACHQNKFIQSQD